MMFGFGNKPTGTAAPAVGGLTFGATTTSAAPTFGAAAPFGITSSAPANPPAFGGFGTQATAPTFGTTTTSAAPSLFGAAPSSTASLFGAAPSAATSTSASLFGAAKPAAPAFSFMTPATSSTASLGFGTNTASLGFGTSTTGFGTTTSGFGSLLAPNAKPNLPQPGVATAQQMEAYLVSLSQPLIFGDERDVVLARWNQLQAMYGTGVGYCLRGPVPYSLENPFCRLKTVVYNVLPLTKDEDGLVMLLINKKAADVVNQRQQLLDALFRLLGNKPNLSIELEDVRESSVEGRTEIIISITESLPTGSSKKVLASELAGFLNGNMVRPQMESQLGVQRITAHVAPSGSQLTQYLEKPPAGLNPLVWNQARADNPNESHFLPVALVGFGELKRRMQAQEIQVERQQERLQKISDDISELKCAQTNMSVRIEQMKRRHAELSLRVLKVLSRQEVIRQQGCSLSAEEEGFRCALEKLWNDMVVPCGSKSRLQEMLSTIRMGDHAFRRDTGGVAIGPTLQFDSETTAEIRDHLLKQQEGIQHLLGVIREDMESLKIIEHGLNKPV